MATLNIQLEVPSTMAWSKDEFVAAVKSFASVFVTAKPAKREVMEREAAPAVINGVEISPELMAFVGIAVTNDGGDWKERKEEYLRERYAR